MKPKLAFLGLGTMGSAMAANLYRAAYPLSVWNRTKKHFPALDATPFADSPAEAVRDAEIIFYSLADDTAIEQVVFGPRGILGGVSNGQLAVNLSTVHPDMSHREAAAYAGQNVAFLDAPVFGSKPEAEEASLCIVVGGKKADYDRALPPLQAISSSIYHMGKTGSGATMGLIGSLAVCFQLQALGEGLILAKKAGLDIAKVVDILGIPDFRSPIFTAMGRQIIRRSFDPIFSLEHLFKDAKQVLHLANQLGVTMPGCATIHEVIKSAILNGLGGENASALIKALEQQSNITVE